MQAAFPGFPPEGLKFLRQLKRNNRRDWFQARKQVFEEKVKLPMIGLVRALGGEIQEFAPEIEGDPAKAIYRIYRDVRFSRDKSPYKTQIAASFNPRNLPKHSAAGLYFHIAPDEVLVAGGIYMPGSAELRLVRNRIARNPEEFRRIIRAPEFKRLFRGLEGEQLKRVPRDFPADHPAGDLLRYKQFLAYATRPQKIAESPRLLPVIVDLFRAMMPMIRFLNGSFKTMSGAGSRHLPQATSQNHESEKR